MNRISLILLGLGGKIHLYVSIFGAHQSIFGESQVNLGQVNHGLKSSNMYMVYLTWFNFLTCFNKECNQSLWET